MSGINKSKHLRKIKHFLVDDTFWGFGFDLAYTIWVYPLTLESTVLGSLQWRILNVFFTVTTIFNFAVLVMWTSTHNVICNV